MGRTTGRGANYDQDNNFDGWGLPKSAADIFRRGVLVSRMWGSGGQFLNVVHTSELLP